jgi:hypothetical protein
MIRFLLSGFTAVSRNKSTRWWRVFPLSLVWASKVAGEVWLRLEDDSLIQFLLQVAIKLLMMVIFHFGHHLSLWLFDFLASIETVGPSCVMIILVILWTLLPWMVVNKRLMQVGKRVSRLLQKCESGLSIQSLRDVQHSIWCSLILMSEVKMRGGTVI